jgi:hypothetical protein
VNPVAPGNNTNEMMAWGFRAIIGIATVVGLPLAGFMLQRVMGKADDIVIAVHSHDMKLQELTFGNNEIKDRLGGVKEMLTDHENRLRTLERPANGAR